ncbi:MAG TPA: hypothetical protein VHI13_18295 [Candidatus Kapabacteria bacterium]|nr:hypothetical protein [Candidatus Kapabacteria bacterium]
MATLLALLLPALSTAQPNYKQTLKIYHVGVGQGDCTFIIARKELPLNRTRTITALIDPGPGRYNFKYHRPANIVWDAIRQIMDDNGIVKINYFIISHFDEDHYGSAAGILKILARPLNWMWSKDMVIIDRRLFSPSQTAYRVYPLSGGVLFTEYDEMFRGPWAWRRLPLHAGDDVFSPNFTNMHMTCVATNGVTLQRDNSMNIVPLDVINGRTPTENDLSYAFILDFEGFRYFTGGDLGGGINGSNDHDMETSMGQYFTNVLKRPAEDRFHFCCMKVNHHGSNGSMNDAFSTACNPCVAIFSSGLGKFGTDRLPNTNCAARIRAGSATPCQFYYTFVPSGLPDPYAVADNHALFFADTATRWQDIVITVERRLNDPQLYGDNLTFKLTHYYRDWATLRRISDPVDVNITCPKKHPAP